MYLITGTTGHFGRAAAQYFLQNMQDPDLAILSREAAKVADLKGQGAEVRLGDYNDYASLVKAFTGIQKLLFVSSNDLDHRESHHKNVIDAAKEAGVQHVVFTSFQFKSTAADSPNALLMRVYVASEAYLKASGLTYTILRNGIYMDLLPDIIGPAIGDNKTIFAPAQETPVAFTLRTELAEAAVRVLKSDQYRNKTIDLTNIEAVSFSTIAQDLGEILDTDIQYISPTVPAYQEALSQAGLPPAVVGLFSGITNSMAAGEFEKTSPDLEVILGRKPTRVQDFIKATYLK